MILYFFFNDTATTEIYTLSLHDALPISQARGDVPDNRRDPAICGSDSCPDRNRSQDRKSTRLNSCHRTISYAVFCLKKKKNDMIVGLLQQRRREDFSILQTI